jgi:hypothetical protein
MYARHFHMQWCFMHVQFYMYAVLFLEMVMDFFGIITAVAHYL